MECDDLKMKLEFPSAGLSATLSPSDGERAGVRGDMALAVAVALSLAGLVGCTTSHHGQPLTPTTVQTVTTKVPFEIGDAVVTAEVFQHGKLVPTMLNVHDNENTSVAAGNVIIQLSGGRLIRLAHGDRRLVTFNLNGQRYAFDPNRIFSDAGIRDTLDRQSLYSEAAHRAIKKFATQYLARFALERERVIIALHNNGEGFSIRIYQPGGEHANAAAAVHVSGQRSPHDFFYVTDSRFFDYLKQRDFNVVLQDNAAIPDDGSLSIFFARKKIPYLNIEAGMEHLNEQIEMVRVAREMLDDL